MDFSDTPEEAAFRAEARAWLESNGRPRREGAAATPLAEGVDEATIREAQAWQKKKAEAGWACLRWPKAYGGREASAIEQVIWNQEEGKFEVPPPVFGIGIGMCGPTILAHGSEDQKQRWIPKLVTGEEIWCQLFSEPAAGSDLAGLRSSARREGDQWVVNGQKIWTTGAHYCKWGILIVRHDPDATKHAGLTFFVVDMESPGIEVRPITQINGGRGFNEVFLNDVRIPDENRIGGIGDGWRVAITTLMNERAAVGAAGGSGALRDLFALAGRARLRGRPAIEDGLVRGRLADLYVQAMGVKHTGNRTLTALSQGRTPGPEASLGKLVAARLGQDIASLAVEMLGGAGLVADPEEPEGDEWQDLYLTMPGFRIAGGTDEILRNIIAERVLGLPAEARADKGLAFRDVPTGPR